MNRFILTLILLIAPVASFADMPVPPGHSTVHIIFISSHSPITMGGREAMARVGDAILPADSIRPIRVTIDGKFVGHAMVGAWDIKPVFVLPEGLHKFTFSLDGLDPLSADISVLGTGSKQYLVARLPTRNTASAVPAATDASTTQPFDN